MSTLDKLRLLCIAQALGAQALGAQALGAQALGAQRAARGAQRAARGARRGAARRLEARLSPLLATRRAWFVFLID